MPIRIVATPVSEKRKAKRGQTKGGEGHWWTATDPKKPHRSVYQETLDKKLRPMRKKGIKSGTRHARGLTPQERWKHIPESWKGKKGGRAGYQGGGRTRLLEELGRVEAEPSNRNRRAEISRVHGELNRGYKHGKRVGKSLGGAATHGFNKNILRSH